MAWVIETEDGFREYYFRHHKDSFIYNSWIGYDYSGVKIDLIYLETYEDITQEAFFPSCRRATILILKDFTDYEL